MHIYRRDAAALLATPGLLFEELSAKYDGLEAEEKVFRTPGSPSYREVIRPLGAFGKKDIGRLEEQYRVSLLWVAAHPLTAAGGTSRLELLPGMPRTRADLDTSSIFNLKPLLTLYAGKRSAHGPDWGKKFYLERNAKFPFGDGFSYYAYEQFYPLVSEMFVRFGELTSNFAFYIEETQAA